MDKYDVVVIGAAHHCILPTGQLPGTTFSCLKKIKNLVKNFSLQDPGDPI